MRKLNFRDEAKPHLDCRETVHVNRRAEVSTCRPTQGLHRPRRAITRRLGRAATTTAPT